MNKVTMNVGNMKTGMWFGKNHPNSIDITSIDCYGSKIDVFFDTSSWNVSKHGLVYTDTVFLKELKKYMKSNNMIKSGFDIDYTEHGMQERNVISLETYKVK